MQGPFADAHKFVLFDRLVVDGFLAAFSCIHSTREDSILSLVSLITSILNHYPVVISRPSVISSPAVYLLYCRLSGSCPRIAFSSS